MLIAMTGQKRSGKDTVASFIMKDQALVSAAGMESVSFAGTLKGMIALLLNNAGLTPDEIDYYMNGDGKEAELAVLQGKSARYAMQTLGTEWRNIIGTNLETGEVESKELWTDIVRSKIDSAAGSIVITDMRFLHEAAYVDEQGGTKVRVLRYGQPEISKDAHASEQEMGAIEADMTVYNYGSLEDLAIVSRIVGRSVIEGRSLISTVAEDFI